MTLSPVRRAELARSIRHVEYLVMDVSNRATDLLAFDLASDLDNLALEFSQLERQLLDLPPQPDESAACEECEDLPF